MSRDSGGPVRMRHRVRRAEREHEIIVTIVATLMVAGLFAACIWLIVTFNPAT